MLVNSDKMADVAVVPQLTNHGTNFEQQHVQHVYDEIAASMNDTQHKAWPNVKRFLKKFPPGSLIADIGCGNGRYLNINKPTYKVGVDVCTSLVNNAQSKGYEVAYADNLHLPFRDETFDGVVSIGVIHHFCSAERRTKALQELARILRPGGRVMLYVWALEQKHRKFDSQDVLVPWRGSGRMRPLRTGSSSSFGPSSTSSVSEDELSVQSTELCDNQTNQKSTRSLRRHSSLSADDVASLVELSDFKPNYYSLDFSASPKHKKSESDDRDSASVYVWNKSSLRVSNTKTDKLIKECRKLEASLRAMSAGSLDLLEAKCTKENLTVKMNGIEKVEQISKESANCNLNGFEDGTGAMFVNDKELGVTLDWAVGDLENDDFEAEIPNPSAIYDSGFIENGVNHEQELEEEVLPLVVEKSIRHPDVCNKKHPKVNPFLKQNSLDPYTFNNVKRSNSGTSEDTNSFEVINESQEDLEEVFVEFKPPVRAEVAKKSKRSFFSAVKSKLMEIFDDKKELVVNDKKVEKTERAVTETVSSLSEEQLDLASRLNFKVREFPLSSCPEVFNKFDTSPHENAQSNSKRELESESNPSEIGHRNQLEENFHRKNKLIEIEDTTVVFDELSKERSSKISFSEFSCQNENALLNGIYDGYIKIDVDKLCKNRENASALNKERRNVRGTKRSHSVPEGNHDFDGCTHKMSNEGKFFTQNSTHSVSKASYIYQSSQDASLKQTCKEFPEDHKMSRMNSFPPDRFHSTGDTDKSTCFKQKENTGFYQRDDDSVFKVEDEELSSKLYRYYHVFREGEMDSLISNHVTDLHIVQCFYDHANWCIVAEKL